MTHGFATRVPLRDSGIPWLGQIPAHWAVSRLRHISPFITVGVVVNPSSYVTPDGVPFLYGSDVTEEGINAMSARRIPPEVSRGELAKTCLRAGDIVTVRVGAPGVTAVVPPDLEGANCASIMLVRGAPSFDSHWLAFAMNSSVGRHQVALVQYGAAQEQFNISHAVDFLFAVPPLDEQRAIADYLNCETSRLDGLVAAKERVLGLLAEKRRALITRAVTHSLDPRVPFRDSSIPWLGEIPAHWKAKRLKFYLHRIEQGWSPQCDNTSADLDEWGVLKAGCVNAWDFDPSENKRLPENVEPLTHYEVRQGDVLMSRANTTTLLGSTALVREVRPRLLLCDKLYRLDVNESSLCKEYLVAFLRSPVGRYEFERDATGASNSMQNIGQDSVRNLWLPIPPVDEQRAIVAHIATETAKLDTLRSATKRTIALLKERRAALIAAVVTGRLPIPEAA